MKKTLRYIGLTLGGILFGFIAFVGYRFYQNPQSIYPYPYKKIEVSPVEVKEASEADIVIVGDSAGEFLMDHIGKFISETQKELREPLKIYNWAKSGEGLAHALAKVRSLKKVPLLLVYHGGLDELERKRFDTASLETIFRNISLTQDETILSTLYAAPILSRILYKPLHRVSLDASAPPYPRDLSSKLSMKTMEAFYNIYRWEAVEFTNYLKLNDFNFWFIPQAYNLTERPVRVCEATINLEVEKALDQADAYIKQGKTKDALAIIQPILTENKAHALALHTMGSLLVKRAKFKQARSAFFQGMIYDCGLTRANPLMLKILMEEVEKKDFKVINFNRMVTASVGRNILFERPRKPQSIYYERLMNEMVKEFQIMMRK